MALFVIGQRRHQLPKYVELYIASNLLIKLYRTTNYVKIIVTESSIVVLKILLLKGRNMTRGSIEKFTEAVWERYHLVGDYILDKGLSSCYAS